MLTFDYKKNEIIDLKLCDFGLGAYFEPKVQLTDFCGSPGIHCFFIFVICMITDFSSMTMISNLIFFFNVFFALLIIFLLVINFFHINVFFSLLFIIVGFFCPEMITQGAYYGDKSDVWSIGGIMLELILGKLIELSLLLLYILVKLLTCYYYFYQYYHYTYYTFYFEGSLLLILLLSLLLLLLLFLLFFNHNSLQIKINWIDVLKLTYT